MKKAKDKTGFDCLAFKEKAQKRVLKETKGMSWDEEVRYLRERAIRGPFSMLAKQRAPETQLAVREKKVRYRSKP
jgi:hypothetical protein